MEIQKKTGEQEDSSWTEENRNFSYRCYPALLYHLEDQLNKANT